MIDVANHTDVERSLIVVDIDKFLLAEPSYQPFGYLRWWMICFELFHFLHMHCIAAAVMLYCWLFHADCCWFIKSTNAFGLDQLLKTPNISFTCLSELDSEIVRYFSWLPHRFWNWRHTNQQYIYAQLSPSNSSFTPSFDQTYHACWSLRSTARIALQDA